MARLSGRAAEFLGVLHAALLVGLDADSPQDQELRYVVRKRLAVLQPEEMQHHVDGRRPARAGEPASVLRENLALNDDQWKSEGKRRDFVPMHRAAAPVEQSGLGEGPDAGRNRGRDRATHVEFAQPGEHAPIDVAVAFEAPADDDRVRRKSGNVVDGPVRAQGDPARQLDGRLEPDDAPGVKLAPSYPVG